MADKNMYGEVDNKSDLHHIFTEINKDVDAAKTRKVLTELYRRAGYLITLTYAPSWEKKFGDKAASLRTAAGKEFSKTARHINQRADEVGTDADYDEKWGKMKKH
ncbi:MAG TPA: hypothetical protein V6C69_09675 [Trichormus sp.]|jgi:hypothetical protein